MALADGLVSYWTLDEKTGAAADSHGPNDLGVTGTVDTTPGVIDTGRAFGSGNYLGCDHDPSLSFGDTDFTIAFWVSYTSLTNGFASAFGKGFLTTWASYNFSGLRFSLKGSSGPATEVVSSAALSEGVWYHVVMWHDSVADLIGVSVNADAPDTASHTTGCADTTDGLTLGCIGGSPSFYMQGALDEFGIWSRALTAGERASLYNGGSGLAYPFSDGYVKPSLLHHLLTQRGMVA